MTDQREDPSGIDRITARNGTGAVDAPVIYGKTMRLDILLNLQDEIAAGKDDLFFVILHQCHELWFKLILHELENARNHIAAGDLADAIEELERVRQVERSLVEQVSSLATLSPASFDVIRGYLGTSSAFQSAQFREIEFLSGLKDPRFLVESFFSEPERERLHRRYQEPSLQETFEDLLAKRGVDDVLSALRSAENSDLLSLARALLAHDEGLREWRDRHLEMVGRLIGHKSGTGGTSGLPFLRATLTKTFFPALGEIRSQLTRVGDDDLDDLTTGRNREAL
ncbi:MAG: tryptophan 2,3-dioxygenase family protein [Actinoallomurus sp.]